MEELSVFVLSQSDVVSKWNSLESVLSYENIEGSFNYRNVDYIGSCKRILERWLKNRDATWSHLFAALKSIHLENAAIRIANFLPSMAAVIFFVLFYSMHICMYD